MQTRIILVGGFLGAGKTSLLFEAASRFTEKGQRVGLITNDQAPELVDTAFLERTAGVIGEVSGSCLCCNYEGFTEAILDLMKNKRANVIIAEPVGSCTDLSATILQPLKEHFGDEFIVAPLTVLVDPKRLLGILDGGSTDLHPSAVYIIRKQVEEADIIAITKTDLLTPEEVGDLKMRTAKRWPNTTVLAISSKTGDGLDKWLSEVTSRTDAGTNLLEIDYDTYAEGEAVLGWLNATLDLKGSSIDWDKFADSLLNSLHRRFSEANVPIGHVKLIIEAGSNFVIGNLTDTDEPPSIRRCAGVGDKAKMTLNARVQMEPEVLEKIVLEEIAESCGTSVASQVIALKCLSPGYPKPTHRYGRIVKPASS
ncbi:MAG: GTP-binding protein [Limnochordia bacterium]|jgi:Ni2+-binding GTPase involved in maturation of urease and hydrogenase